MLVGTSLRVAYLLAVGVPDCEDQCPVPYRVLLIDSNIEFRESLASHLRSQPDFAVVGELSSSEVPFGVVRSAAPDVVLLDIAMPEMDAAVIIRYLRQAVPTARVIGLSIVQNRRYQDECRYAGMHAYLRKDSPVASIIAAIRSSGFSLDSSNHKGDQTHDVHHDNGLSPPWLSSAHINDS